MILLTLKIGFAVLTISVLSGLYRLARGPSVLDRILAFDMIATCSVAMVVLLSVTWKSPHYVELVLIFSLLGFFGSIAFLSHLYRVEKTHPDAPDMEGTP